MLLNPPIHILIHPSYYTSSSRYLQDESSESSAETAEDTVQQLLNNSKEIVDNNLKGRDELAESSGERSQEAEKGS